MGARRAGRHAAHSTGASGPARPRPALRRGARPRLRPELAARGLPLHRRRRLVGARPVQEREGGRDRPVHGPQQPASPVRRHMAGAADAVEPRRRGARERPVALHRRRRHVDGPDGPARDARWYQGPDRRRRVARTVGTRVGHRRGRGRRAAALGRRRRHVGARQRRQHRQAAALLPPPRIRPPDAGGHHVDPADTGVAVGRRGPLVHHDDDAPQRQPRPVDRPARPPADDRGERRRRVRLLRRRRDVVDHLQPAHGPVLPRRRRHPAPVPRLRHPAGQQRHQHAEQVDCGGDPVLGQLRRGAVGERVRGRAPGQPGHRLLGRNRQRPGRRWRAAQVQPRHGRVAHHHRVAGDVVRAGRAGHALPLPVDLPDSHIAPRPQRALRRREQGLPLGRRGHDLGGGVAGPDPQRPGQGRARRRPHQPRRVRRGGLLHHILLRRVAPHARRILGGLRRRPRPRLPRRRRDVGRHHPAGPAGVGDREHDRPVAPRPRHGLARGVELQARRLLRRTCTGRATAGGPGSR